MAFIPDEHEKTVKIPIQVRDGQIQFYFDGPLPDLKEGIIGDLVLPYDAVVDPKARKLFSEKRRIPLFCAAGACSADPGLLISIGRASSAVSPSQNRQRLECSELCWC